VPAAAPAFVHRWTRAELDPLLHDWPAGRDPAAGRAAFDKATCATCHRTGDGGGATGPDLTGVSSRFSRADILDALLEPSRTISDQYRDTELRTTDGDLYVGRIEAERGGQIVLRRTPGDERVEIDAATIEMRRPYPLSRMPSGLLDVLSEAEVLDLFAYLRATR
jgi:putative heme-binding domain-containing protein